MKKLKLVLLLLFTMSLSFGSLLFNLPAERRKSIRNLEKSSTKLIKTKCSKLFNSTCLKEDILPKYTNIYIYIYIYIYTRTFMH